MNLIPFLEWTRDNPVAVAIRHSAWMLPAIEAAHLLAYAGAIGTAVAIDFRILNIGLRTQKAGQDRESTHSMDHGEFRAFRDHGSSDVFLQTICVRRERSASPGVARRGGDRFPLRDPVAHRAY